MAVEKTFSSECCSIREDSTKSVDRRWPLFFSSVEEAQANERPRGVGMLLAQDAPPNREGLLEVRPCGGVVAQVYRQIDSMAEVDEDLMQSSSEYIDANDLTLDEIEKLSDEGGPLEPATLKSTAGAAQAR